MKRPGTGVSAAGRSQRKRGIACSTVPIGYHLERSLGLTLVVWDGVVTGADAEDHVRELQADPEWPPGTRHLLDSTSATSVPAIANTKLVELAVDAAAAHHIRFALVADRAFEEATKFQRSASPKGLSRRHCLQRDLRGVHVARRRSRNRPAVARHAAAGDLRERASGDPTGAD